MKQRIKILNEIFDNFHQIMQWLPDNIDTATEYMFKAEALIEMLEADDCGSVGGYDPKSPVIDETGFLLYDRFLALVRRHKNKSSIKNLDTLSRYFKALSELRYAF